MIYYSQLITVTKHYTVILSHIDKFLKNQFLSEFKVINSIHIERIRTTFIFIDGSFHNRTRNINIITITIKSLPFQKKKNSC